MLVKNKKKYFLILAIVVSLVTVLTFTSSVQAANLQNAFDSDHLDKTAGESGAGYDTLVEPENIVSIVIQIALSFLGVIFLVLMIYAGYLWMTARGNEEQATKARNIITAAVIGLVIVLMAYAISYLVIDKIGGTTLK
ncbi:MAG: hypothetical protein ABIE43_01380 [Patescibacteria group bacterium]